jgi:hypothetical protein
MPLSASSRIAAIAVGLAPPASTSVYAWPSRTCSVADRLRLADSKTGAKELGVPQGLAAGLELVDEGLGNLGHAGDSGCPRLLHGYFAGANSGCDGKFIATDV